MARVQGSHASIIDVAARAGVSKSSVSNYFHRPDKLSEPTRARIAAAIDELGFTVNGAARTLRLGADAVVGYIAFELANARTPEIANAIDRRLRAANLDLVLATDHGDAERELAYLRLFARQRLRGIIISPAGDVETELAALRERGIPSVLSARRPRRTDQAAAWVDHRVGGALAACHLLEVGRRRIAFLTDAQPLAQIADRAEGARRVVAESGARFAVLPARDRSFAAGVDAAEAVRALPTADRPDAIFCANDLLAIGLVEGLRGAVRIPEDIAVVGYDDIEFARATAVPLTTVHTPQHELGDVSAVLLLDQLADPAAIGQRELVPHLVVRASTSAG